MKRIKPGATFEVTVDSPTSGLVGTIAVSLEDGQGNVTTAPTTSGIVESPSGSGIYTATMTAPDAGGFYLVVWNDGTGTPAGYAAESIEVTSTAVAAGSLEIRDFVETDLSDDALAAVVAAATADVEAAFGTDAAMTKTLVGEWGRVLPLPRRAQSVSSVVEKRSNFETIRTLTADTDYVLASHGQALYRVRGDVGGAWRDPAFADGWANVVTVTFTPQPMSAQRDMTVVKLVKLELAYTGGIRSETIGDYSYTMSDVDYHAEKGRILRDAAPGNAALRFL